MAAFVIFAVLAAPFPVTAQQKSAYRYLAPVFAHGRILLAATDKYVVVAMDTANAQKVYPAPAAAGRGDARFPVVVPVGGRSLAILTGAVEWFDLMDENAPGIEAQTWLGSAARARPSTGDSGKPDDQPRPTLGQPRLDRGQSTVTHIEVMTEAIAEKLHDYAVDYHSKAEVPKGAPLLSVLWVGWGEDGPAVWTARYDFTQEWLAENFYHTRLERPRTRDLLKSPEGIAFAEEGYPEAGNLLELLERLEAHDPALEKLWSQPSMALVLAARKAGPVPYGTRAGKGKKITAQQAADFCRALLQASTDSRASATGPATAEKPLVGVLLVDEEGARWIHKP